LSSSQVALQRAKETEALIARHQTIEIPYSIHIALDNGIKPREISEIITHLAFFSGWANAWSAVAVAKRALAERKIGADQLPAASPTLLSIDKNAGEKRGAALSSSSVRWLPGSCNTLLLFCSVPFDFVPTLLAGIEVW
jgi:4-carboxymuconolactone decarboxylase